MRDPNDAELYRTIIALGEEFREHRKEDKDSFLALNKFMWLLMGGLIVIGSMVVPILIYMIQKKL